EKSSKNLAAQLPRAEVIYESHREPCAPAIRIIGIVHVVCTAKIGLNHPDSPVLPKIQIESAPNFVGVCVGRDRRAVKAAECRSSAAIVPRPDEHVPERRYLVVPQRIEPRA